MQSLQTMLHACNPYASIYQTTSEWFQGEAVELSLHLVNGRRTDLWRYNAPTADEVSTLMVGGNVDEVDTCDIIVLTHPQLLEGLKEESQLKDNEKREGIGARSLTRSTREVEGRAGAPRLGLGRVTSFIHLLEPASNQPQSG